VKHNQEVPMKASRRVVVAAAALASSAVLAGVTGIAPAQASSGCLTYENLFGGRASITPPSDGDPVQLAFEAESAQNNCSARVQMSNAAGVVTATIAVNGSGNFDGSWYAAMLANHNEVVLAG
jgi:hypothetical protein